MVRIALTNQLGARPVGCHVRARQSLVESKSRQGRFEVLSIDSIFQKASSIYSSTILYAEASFDPVKWSMLASVSLVAKR